MADSSQVTGRGKNKRKWSYLEEDTMLDFVLELKLDTRWKCEGGFKNGFFLCIEEKLESKLPLCGLKASQIESKIKFFKEKYSVIHDMLKLSGFQWDEKSKIIQCERQAYDDYCKMHPRAKGLWKTSFPLFDKLERIFGRDRANGNRVEDMDQSVNNMTNEFIDLKSEHVDLGSHEFTMQPPPKKKKKGNSHLGHIEKNEPNDKFVIAIDAIKDHMGTIASTLKEAQKREQDIVEQKRNLLSEIVMIPGLSQVDVIDATSFLSSNPNELEAFYSCPNDDWKKVYMERIIARVRGGLGP